jgi:hypothetical protein
MRKEDVLYTAADEKAFHASRRMFCIKEGVVKTAPMHSPLSHFEWFVSEGWTDESDAERFLNTIERGHYLSENNTLYTYTGPDFSFSDETIANLKSALPQLQKLLELRPETKICFGPKDKTFKGQDHKQLCLGMLKDYVA